MLLLIGFLWYNTVMGITNKNITIVRGDTYSFKLDFSQNGEVVDITGYRIMFSMKNNTSESDDNAVISKEVEVVDGSAGIAQLDLVNADTVIDSGIYVYDLQIVTDTGSVHTPILGTITMVDDVTNKVV